MSNVTIFLDYDDVIVDWATVACQTFNLDLRNLEVRKEIEGRWGGIDTYVNDVQLWETIHSHGMDWWANIPLLPWAENLYAEMSKLGRVVFLTAPSDDWTCLAGKGVSIKKHFNTRDFLIGKPKEECARYDRILVDDRPENCQKFYDNAGNAFLWPNAVKLQRLGEKDINSVTNQLINFVNSVKARLDIHHDLTEARHYTPALSNAE